MRAKFKNTLSAKTVKSKVRDARDAPEEDPEVELVVVPVVAAHEAAVATMESSQRIAHLEKKEPTKMVMTLEATEKQPMVETRERELAAHEEVLTEKKSKTIERMEQRENTPEGMEQEHQEEDAHRQTTIINQESRTQMMPTEETVDEVVEEAAVEKKELKDTAAIDKIIEVEKIDPVEIDRTIEEVTVKIDHVVASEEEATMAKHVNPALTTVVDVVEDPLLKESHAVRTVDSVEEEAVIVTTTVVATEMASAEVEEVAEAVEVRLAVEAVPLTEKETTEVLSSVV